MDNHSKRQQVRGSAREEIFVGILSRHMSGFKGIQLLRRKTCQEVEFMTIMVFDSPEAACEFAGENYETAVIPEKAKQYYRISMNVRSIKKSLRNELQVNDPDYFYGVLGCSF